MRFERTFHHLQQTSHREICMYLGVFPILRNGSIARGRKAGYVDAYHAGRSHFS